MDLIIARCGIVDALGCFIDAAATTFGPHWIEETEVLLLFQLQENMQRMTGNDTEEAKLRLLKRTFRSMAVALSSSSGVVLPPVSSITDGLADNEVGI